MTGETITFTTSQKLEIGERGNIGTGEHIKITAIILYDKQAKVYLYEAVIIK